MTGPFERPGRPSSEDAERFRALYEDTSKDLLAFLLRRCPSAEDAADCLAETYRIAWEKREQIPADDGARPWLYGVARNVVRRERASDQQRAATTRQLALAAEGATAATGRADNAVTTALSALSSLDRDIVLMLTAGGLTPREVASVVSLTPNAVRVRAHRARAKLRALLSGDEGDADPPDLLPGAVGTG